MCNTSVKENTAQNIQKIEFHSVEGKHFLRLSVTSFHCSLGEGKKKEIIITAFVFEVDSFAFEHLQSDVNIVDLLQAADGWQAELGRQTPILDEELHHTAGSESHMRIIFKNIHLQQVMQQNVSLLL